ncbi:MAG: pseudouridine synthase [Planctomycetaceae bacterium]
MFCSLMSSRPRKPGPPSKGDSSTRSARGRAVIQRPAVLSASHQGTRLQKFLATAGVESRRNCEEFIRDGRVTIDGKVVTNPAVSVDPEQQDVRLDGERLQPSRYRYFLINKPKGVVCTNSDPAGRPRAIDLIPHDDLRLFTVGRLDEHTLGLLLITNDGALAEHLAHPRYEVVRRYRVQVAGLPEAATLAELKKGMHFSDGYFRFQSIRTLKRKGRSTFLELELQEGKNREIRRLLARAGHKVMSLERIAFGPLRLGHLEVGRYRELRAQEVRDLYAFIETPPSARRSAATRKAATGSRPPEKSKSAGSKRRIQPPQTSKRGAARNAPVKKVAKKKAASGKRTAASRNKGRGRKK